MIPDDPANPATRAEVKTTIAEQQRAARGLPACVSLAEATVAYPVSKEKTSATGIPHKYLSKRLTTLSPMIPCTPAPLKGAIVSSSSWPVLTITFAVYISELLWDATTAQVIGGPPKVGLIITSGSIHVPTLIPLVQP